MMHASLQKLFSIFQKRPKNKMSTMNPDQTEIIMYGTNWCGETRRARAVFDKNQIHYKWIDIDSDIQARSYVENVNHGYRSVPTIVFPDGDILVEPSENELLQKLGLSR
jgi:mycoredoxin